MFEIVRKYQKKKKKCTEKIKKKKKDKGTLEIIHDILVFPLGHNNNLQ